MLCEWLKICIGDLHNDSQASLCISKKQVHTNNAYLILCMQSYRETYKMIVSSKVLFKFAGDSAKQKIFYDG